MAKPRRVSSGSDTPVAKVDAPERGRSGCSYGIQRITDDRKACADVREGVVVQREYLRTGGDLEHPNSPTRRHQPRLRAIETNRRDGVAAKRANGGERLPFRAVEERHLAAPADRKDPLLVRIGDQRIGREWCIQGQQWTGLPATRPYNPDRVLHGMAEHDCVVIRPCEGVLPRHLLHDTAFLGVEEEDALLVRRDCQLGAIGIRLRMHDQTVALMQEC